MSDTSHSAHLYWGQNGHLSPGTTTLVLTLPLTFMSRRADHSLHPSPGPRDGTWRHL